MQNSDRSFDGLFYVGVQTTRIYCLPSCKARTPLVKNVLFYSTREEAIADGLRGCKRCYSDRYPDVLPTWLTDVIAYMRNNYETRLDETTLSQMTGVDISTVRRHFKHNLNMTPLAFHRRLRLKYARSLLEDGENYLSVAFATGYESSSGFREAFYREHGINPGAIDATR